MACLRQVHSTTYFAVWSFPVTPASLYFVIAPSIGPSPSLPVFSVIGAIFFIIAARIVIMVRWAFQTCAPGVAH